MPSRTISLRLDSEILKRLDALAERRRRSRSFVVAEAIARHLEPASTETSDIPSDANAPRYAKLLAMRGAGAPYSSFKTAEEVDAHIRWLRDDD